MKDKGRSKGRPHTFANVGAAVDMAAIGGGNAGGGAGACAAGGGGQC